MMNQEQEDISPKNFRNKIRTVLQNSEIIDIYHSHPIMIIGKMLIIFSVFSILTWAITLALPQNIIPSSSLFVCVSLCLLALLCTSFIHWRMNIDMVLKEQVVCVRFHGIFHFTTEEINLSEVKSINIHQKGLLQNILGYGKIIIASEFHEQNENDVVLKNIWPVHKALINIRQQMNFTRQKYASRR